MSSASAIKAQGIIPRKSLGQNFLVDPRTAERIVAAAELSNNDLAIEIGPGTGAITRHLAESAAHVIAIELDHTLIPVLHSELAMASIASNVTIVHGDALQVDFAALAHVAELHRGRPFAAIRFVANLPYYITSAAIRRILECGLAIQSIVLTVQLEVAQRIVARPPDMSLLAVSVQFYGQADLLFRIPGGQFYPPPDVESAVLRIVPHAHPPDIDEATFFRWVRAGFSQKRKQLRNTFAAGLGMSKAEVDAALSKSGIDSSRRAESLEIGEWLTLVRSVISRAESGH